MLFVYELVPPVPRFALRGVDEQVGLGLHVLEVGRETTTPSADDASLAHDLHGILHTQSLDFFQVALLHLGHDSSPSRVIRLVDFDARRDVRVVELGGPGLGMLHLFGDLVARIDGLHRAFWHAHGAVDALSRVDHELVISVVDAVHRTRPYASRVLGADTQFGNDIGHVVSPLLVLDSPETSLTNEQTLSTEGGTLCK